MQLVADLQGLGLLKTTGAGTEPLRQHSRPPQLEQHHEQAGTAGPEELDDDEIEEVEDGL